MGRTQRKFSESGYMHIICRGDGKQIIFEDEMDYKLCIRLIHKYSEKYNVTINAYCLMDNHFHLIVKCNPENLPKFMHSVCSVYSHYYNKKYEHNGHLFQDRYKSFPINNERYYMTVFRYVIRNPENADICKTQEYRWHSLYNLNSINNFVDISLALHLAGSVYKLKQFILTPNDDECEDIESFDLLSDEEALEIIKTRFNVKSGTEINSFERKARNAAIIELSNLNISQNQLQRLTGISRTTLWRIKKKEK